MQLVLQHCANRVEGYVARFFFSHVQAWLAIIQVVAGYKNVVAESREYFYFLQQNLLPVLPAQSKLVLQQVT